MNLRPASLPPLISKPTRPPWPPLQVFGVRSPLRLAGLLRGMDHLRDLRALGEASRRPRRIGAVRSHAQRQRLDTLQDQERVERRHRRAQVAQQRHARLDDVGDRPERLDRLGPDRAVIAGIGRVQRRLAARVCASQSKLPPSTTMPPIEVPCPPRYLVVRIHDHRRAVIERTHQERRRGVVHDQRDAERAADRGDLGDRERDQLRVGQRLGVIGAGAVVGGARELLADRSGSTKRTSMPWSFSVLANRFQVPP